MILPKGITGFCADTQPPPLSDMKTYRSACYEAARLLHARVVDSEDPYARETNNFAITTLAMPKITVAILMNAHFPIIGFSEPLAPDESRLHFLHQPNLANAIATIVDFTVLDKHDLEAPLTPETMRELGAAEVDQARYWQPEHIGEVVFNFWD